MFCGVPIKGSDLKKYQARHLVSNDYYEKGKSVEGCWLGGKLARFRLAPGAKVESDVFAAMADGRCGDLSGESWLQRRGKERRPFYDFTISAPKSFSVACVVGGDERIREWHKKAVEKALMEVERDISRRVRGKGSSGDEVKKTGNLIAARYHHDASRLLDPQLHDHVCIFNGTVDPYDGKIYAVEYGEIMARSHLYTTIYRHTLADLALKGGYDVIVDSKGVPEISRLEDVKKQVSSRTDDIEWLSEMYRQTCGREPTKRQRKSFSLISRGADMLRFHNEFRHEQDALRNHPPGKLFTRMTELLRDCGGNAKILNTTSDEVRKIQRTRLGETRLAEIEKTVWLAGRNAMIDYSGYETREGGAINAAAALRHAIESTFEMKSVAKDYELVEKALRLAPMSETAHEEICGMLERAVQSGALIRSDSGVLTTAETLRMEGALLERANNSKGALPAVKSRILNPSLSIAQHTAVSGVLRAGDKISAIVGDAGSGKTFATQVLAKGFLDGGINVQFLAPTTGARDVLRKTELNGKRLDIAKSFEGAQTLQKILRSYECLGQSGMKRGSCVILDEAGMVSVKMMDKLFEICEREGHRLVLIGDYKQHGPVEAGGAFRLLVQSGAVNSYRISEIRRQSKDALGGAYREAAALMAAGNIEKAFHTLDKAGAIFELQGVDRINAMAKSYIDSLKAGHTCLCVNYTHRENDAVNNRIREMLTESGALGESHSFASLRPLNMIAADKTCANLKSGQCLVESPGTPKERVWKILYSDLLKTWAAPLNGGENKRFEDADLKGCLVCESRDIPIAKGELLTLRTRVKNVKTELANGASGIVAGWTPDGFPIDENGNELRTRLLDYGYATTSHKSQGATCDDVIIGFNYRSTAVADSKMAYVAATRGRGSIKIFCDSKEDLRLVAKRGGDAPLALEEFFNLEFKRGQLQGSGTSHAVRWIGEWARIGKDEILKMMRELTSSAKSAAFRRSRAVEEVAQALEKEKMERKKADAEQQAQKSVQPVQPKPQPKATATAKPVTIPVPIPPVKATPILAPTPKPEPVKPMPIPSPPPIPKRQVDLPIFRPHIWSEQPKEPSHGKSFSR